MKIGLIKDDNGYPNVAVPFLMAMDDLIAEPVLESGMARFVQAPEYSDSYFILKGGKMKFILVDLEEMRRR